MNPVRYAQQAWRLYNTEDKIETYIAVVLALIALYPVILHVYKHYFR